MNDWIEINKCWVKNFNGEQEYPEYPRESVDSALKDKFGLTTKELFGLAY